ncbi:tyrosine-type recombinase/integrase [Aliarcobacter butzleri]|uniref:Site-specific integrase n=3 Tax=Arcobacteraceae TaxID=2808963 RepID=A0AA96DSS1_9BACT|nr:site-specific integrase [Arcobacter sp. AZ-2023]WNL36040.1 site-specific integrase [Arcobacter sp. AZ-2023]WPD11756.1 site-specific integrase [Arcobacter sp. DSM 115960]
MNRKKSNKYTGVYYQELINGDKSYYITYKHNKKDIWKKIGLYSEGIREAYCSQKRNEIVSKIRLGEDLPHVASQNNFTSLVEVAEKFYELKELHNKQNKKTRSRVLAKLKKHYIGEMSIKEIQKLDIENFQIEIEKDLMPATINFIIQQTSSIFNWSIENGYLSKNPCQFVKNLKVKNARLRYLEIDEIKRLLETVKNDKHLYYFVLLGLSTGGRLQTVCNIKVSDIRENGTIRLYDFKNESEYFGFLNNDLKSELNEYIKIINLKEDDFIFKNTSNQNYTNQYYYRKLQPIFDVLFNPDGTEPLEKVTIHTLRHTFASQLAINDTPILIIKKLMNHNDIKTTMRYAKLSKSSGDVYVDRLVNSFL